MWLEADEEEGSGCGWDSNATNTAAAATSSALTCVVVDVGAVVAVVALRTDRVRRDGDAKREEKDEEMDDAEDDAEPEEDDDDDDDEEEEEASGREGATVGTMRMRLDGRETETDVDAADDEVVVLAVGTMVRLR